MSYSRDYYEILGLKKNENITNAQVAYQEALKLEEVDKEIEEKEKQWKALEEKRDTDIKLIEQAASALGDEEERKMLDAQIDAQMKYLETVRMSDQKPPTESEKNKAVAPQTNIPNYYAKLGLKKGKKPPTEQQIKDAVKRKIAELDANIKKAKADHQAKVQYKSVIEKAGEALATETKRAQYNEKLKVQKEERKRQNAVLFPRKQEAPSPKEAKQEPSAPAKTSTRQRDESYRVLEGEERRVFDRVISEGRQINGPVYAIIFPSNQQVFRPTFMQEPFIPLIIMPNRVESMDQVIEKINAYFKAHPVERTDRRDTQPKESENMVERKIDQGNSIYRVRQQPLERLARFVSTLVSDVANLKISVTVGKRMDPQQQEKEKKKEEGQQRPTPFSTTPRR